MIIKPSSQEVDGCLTHVYPCTYVYDVSACAHMRRACTHKKHKRGPGSGSGCLRCRALLGINASVERGRGGNLEESVDSLLERVSRRRIDDAVTQMIPLDNSRWKKRVLELISLCSDGIIALAVICHLSVNDI